jgi:hypothetical protein
MALFVFLRQSFWAVILWFLKLCGAGQKSPGLGVLVILIGLGFLAYGAYVKIVDFFTPPQTSAGQYVPPAPPPPGPGPVTTKMGPVTAPPAPPPIVRSPVTTSTQRQSPSIQAQPLPDFAGIEPPPPPPPPLPDSPEGVIRGWRPPLPARPYRPD